MRLVKISDLSDEERKKALEEQRKRLEENRRASEQTRIEVNNRFNDLFTKTGGFDTSRHTTTIGDLRKAYKDSPNYNAVKNSLNNYYNTNKNSMWDNVVNTAKNMNENNQNLNYTDNMLLLNKQNLPKIQADNLFNTLNQSTEYSEDTIKKLAELNEKDRIKQVKILAKTKEQQGNLNLKVNEYLQNQKSSQNAERINQDLEKGNILSSIKHVIEGVPKEALNSVMTTATALDSLNPQSPNRNQHLDASKILTSEYKNTTSQIDNSIVKTASNVSGTIGQMVPAILADIIAPGSGRVIQAINVGASGYSEALDENNENKGKALLTGATKGATSYAIEGLFGGNFFGKGSLDDLAKKTMSSKISSDIGKKVASKIYEIGGETIEENLENQVGYVIDKVINNKNITKEEWLNDLGATSRDTVLTTVVLNLLGLGGSTYKEIKNQENIDNHTKEVINKAEKIIKDENLSVNNIQKNSKEILNDKEQTYIQNNINQISHNNVNTSKMSFEESARAYNFDTNDNTIKTVHQALSNRDITGRFDASYFNNSNENAIWRTYKDDKGNTKREVIFNPNGNSQNTMQQISVHELTHDLQGTKEFEELKSLVLDRNKTMQGYTEARQSLEDTYSQVYDPNSKDFKNLVDEEEVADTLAQKLGDQDFVNSLSTEKPTVFKKIYNWVVDKVNKITGNRFEKVYWEDIKNKFENAYRQTYQGEVSNQTRYSIQKDSNGNKYVKVDTDQSIFEGKEAKDYPKIARQCILSKFRDGDKNINLPTKEEVTVTSKTANEYTHPKKQLPQKIKESKMKASTELDNLINISEYQYSRPDDGRHKFAKDGWDYYKTQFEIDGNVFEGLVNIAKSDNKKTLYDITNIKRINQNRSASAKAFSTSLVNSNSSITSSQDNVNTTNQSMQNVKNNTKLTDNEIINKIYENIENRTSKDNQKNKKRIEQYLQQEYPNYVIDFTNFKNDGTVKINSIETIEEYNNRINEKLQVDLKEKQKRQEYLRKNTPTSKADEYHLEYGKLPSEKEFKILDDIKYRIKKLNDNINKNILKNGIYTTLEESRASADAIYIDVLNNNGDILKTIRIANHFKSGVSGSTDVFIDLSEYSSKKVLLEDIEKEITDYSKINKNNKQSKFSMQQTNVWQEFLDTQIGQRGKGKTVQELRLPTKETINNKKVDSYNVLYQDSEQQNKMNLPVSDGGKVRKHYKTIMQSSNTSPEAKAIAKELIGTDTYVPDSNERQLKIADGRIERNGANNEAVALATKVKNGDRITAEDIATGERLIEYYSKIGDKEKLQDTIQNVALAGTQAGQTVQAMSLINRQTPQGQAVYLSKVIDRMNKDIDRRSKGKGKKFELTSEMLEKITNSTKENLESNIDEVAKELANQVPKTTIEKIDSWRYFSMLANPRTHIRNIIGNFSMSGVQNIKSKIAGGLESVAKRTGMIDERTKTLKPASKEVKQFAKEDTQNVMARLNNESKFDAKNIIQKYQRIFKSNLLENTLGKAMNLNSKALEMEDVWGLKRAYTKAMSDYMTANKLSPKDLTNGTKEADVQLEKARKYAIEQAQEATFHQQSALASSIAQFENKSNARKLILGSILPFKKTPINVAKAGIEYSPIGLIKAFTTDVVKLNKGEITATKYIDNLAKGLTGTGIAMVGYALSQAGILSASSDDDDSKNEWYSQDRGNQPFSIKIGDKTYSLDWLSPTAIPLFIGAEVNTNVKNVKENNTQTQEDILDRIANSIDGMTKAINPMVEMSMLSGLASTIKSFAQGDTQVFSNLMLNSAKSYINQFFPTLGGQIAKTIDTTERSTTSTKKNAFAKAVDSTGKQILNKIPFASKMLPAKTDVWGNELKRDSNPLYRALQQSIFPWNEKSLKSTAVDDSISDLYEKTGDNSVLPNTSINKDFTINSGKYRLTSEEYAKYKKEYGNTSYKLLDSLVNSKEYRSMTTEQKTKAIKEIYSYANENNKMNYAYEKNIQNVKTSTLYDTIKSIEKSNGNGADYFKYLGKTLDLEKDKYKLNELEKLDVSATSKIAIYKNTLGKSDKLYNNVLSKSKININEYLRYKQQEFTSDKKDDGTVQGKTITNSKKTKVYDYVNDMNITRTQKILLLRKSYKLNRSEEIELYNYINSIPGQTKSEKLDIFKEYGSNFTVYKNGNISYK